MDSNKQIVLTGNPISTNTLYRKTNLGGMYMTKVGKERKTQYQWEAKSQWRQAPIETPIEVDIKLYFGNKRRRDWDNFHKISMDSLSGIVWADDSQITDSHVHKRFDATYPRIEITIL